MSNTTTIFQPHTILSAHLTGDGDRLNIVRKYPSNMAYGNGQHVPDRVEKEVYGVVDGKTGKHTPAYMVKETVTFDE
jgi:hypothetical protein